ncbi:hypothetical protein HRbin01_00354 [archaeon HR01]|nr:hypothetical protein HRbin01_00354 [archaeon HR01]
MVDYSVEEAVSMVKILTAGIGITHILWGVALTLDYSMFTHRLGNPLVYVPIHMATGILLVAGRIIYGSALSAGILTYYWLYVKPLEPIAEPQSVGLVGISAGILLQELRPRDGWPLFLLRGGLAYPFMEWGLDAYKNPYHFHSYISTNTVTKSLITVVDPYLLIALLSIYEIGLAVWLLSGLYPKLSSYATLFTLITFSAVAGYPLALPQNIALAATAYTLANSKINSSS